MDNHNVKSVIRQLFSLLPVDSEVRLLSDHYTKKLTTMKAILVFITAQLNQWSSYSEMELQIRARPELQQLLQFESISGSQLSRKLDQIPTELLEWMFLQLAAKAHQSKGSPPAAKTLRIIDSSSVQLPLQLGSWAKMSSKMSGVKMHLRLIAASPDQVYPDAMIPTTCNVGDREGAAQLVVASDATYVMDRGYDHYARMDQWIGDRIRFVIRMRDRALTTIVEESPIPEGSRITLDAKVQVGGDFRSMEHPIRLVEFYDERGRRYRLLTSVWDRTAEEIAHMYKCRWLIELYFKWLKQHLRVVRVHSYKPQALWNQLFLALITALLVDQLKDTIQSRKTNWQLLKVIRVYLYESWSVFESELERKPSRASPGKPAAIKPKPATLRTTVGKLKPSKAKK